MLSDPSQEGLSPVSRTALWTAAARAIESERADRLFSDPLAAVLAGPTGFGIMARQDAQAGANPYLPIRTRWFDDFLLAPPSGPDRQVVLLAAGLDSRAYRLDWPAGTVLFEVDHPELLARKQATLDEHGAIPRCQRRTVGADLGADWVTPLIDAGYDPRAPSRWVVEGLLLYLTEQLAAAVVTTAAACAGPESRLALDLIGTGVLRSARTQDYRRNLAEAGTPWLFGVDDPARFLADCGWLTEKVVEPGGNGANFGRWPYPPTDDREADPLRHYLAIASMSQFSAVH
jgi:methyltransferase (TIGR00027 family)